MDYTNFEKTTDSIILDRGKEYFEAGAVSNLEKLKGEWTACVEGTEDYNVSIYGIRKIKDWECDCPYDRGPVCKHVIAVLYAIHKEKSSKSKKTSKSEVDQIFTKVPTEELLQFFRKNLRSNKDLKQRLLSEFMEYIEVKAGTDKHTQLIRQMTKAAKNRRYGFVDYKESRRLSQQLNGVIVKAQQFLYQKNYIDTLAICKAILVEISELLSEADDSGGYLQDSLYSSYSMIEQLFEAPIAPDFRDKIFETLLEILQNDKSNMADIRYYILNILLEKEWEKTQYIKLVNYLKITLAGLTGDYIEYTQASYLGYLSTIYEKIGAAEDLQILEDKYIHLVKIRKNVVERFIKKEAYGQARSIVLEGIEIAKEKDHPGTVSNWKDILIQISKLEGDISALRVLLKEQYLSGGGDKERFLAYKEIYNSKEWLEERTALIKLFKSEKEKKKRTDNYKFYRYQTLLRELYIYEEMWEDLLQYIENTNLYLSSKVQLASHLENHYPANVLTIYEEYVRNLSANSRSRKEYKKVTKFLKEMLTVKGGQLVVDEIVKEFRGLYDRRPAMLDELRKAKL